MLEILRDREKIDALSLYGVFYENGEDLSFTVREGGEPLGSCFFREEGNFLWITAHFFKSEAFRKAYSDALFRAVLNYALLLGKEEVFCKNQDLSPDLSKSGFEPNEDGIYHARPQEFFAKSRCCCEE